MFHNGVLDKTQTQAQQIIDNSGVFNIGATQTWGGSAGGLYLDELRVTKDVARYSDNYTVQTTPFPNA